MQLFACGLQIRHDVRLPAEGHLCCGSAGIYNVTQADAARELGDRKARHVLATRAQAYASANPVSGKDFVHAFILGFEVESRIGADTNLLLLTHVHYKTSERFDIAQLQCPLQRRNRSGQIVALAGIKQPGRVALGEELETLPADADRCRRIGGKGEAGDRFDRAEGFARSSQGGECGR